MTYVDAAVAPQRKTGQIKLHGPAAFEGMRKAGRLVAECLDMLTGEIRPGVPTERIDRLVFDFALAHQATPATLMYRGYRKATCTSVNHVVCHGIPGEKPLKEGDIVNVDVTLIVDGWHGDSSRMYGVGAIPRRAERLIEVTYEAMMRGISVIRPGATTGDIGAAIQAYVEAQHMSVVRDFCGHGLGRLFHDEPNIVHVGRPGEGIVLRPGMFFTVEPMINLGRPHVKVLSDGWTAVTRDRSLSAQFEHTVAVTETGGVEIFTLSPQGARQAAQRRLSLSCWRAPCGRHRPLTNRILCRSRAGAIGVAARRKEASNFGGLAAAVVDDDAQRNRRRALRRRHTMTDIGSGCATASSRRARRTSPITNCWSWCCFARCPGAIVKPLTKEPDRAVRLVRRGRFRAAGARLAEVKGPGRGGDHRAQDRPGGASRSPAGRCRRARSCHRGEASVLDHCRTAQAFGETEQFRVLFLDKRNQLIADEAQQAGNRRPHAGLSARSGQARA